MKKYAKKGWDILIGFSLPLIVFVFVALAVANIWPEEYHNIVNWEPIKGMKWFGHKVTFHFLVNDIFMVFFFGIAAKEITESVLPGGDLNPPRKAINPLLGTAGGVIGPVLVFIVLTGLVYTNTMGEFFNGVLGGFTPGGSFEETNPAAMFRGWGIPTATDIAIAWLVARVVFGKKHPAVNFLLLLAVADDALGLLIIAIWYPDPTHPTNVLWLLLTAAGMLVAFGLRKRNVQSWFWYIAFGGTLSWLGLILASLHPALALVVIVPFLPGPKEDKGLYASEEEDEDEEEEDEHPDEDDEEHEEHHHGDSPLEKFEHFWKIPVDLGLAAFAFVNAGVEFAGINEMTWIILFSLLIGKTFFITAFSWLGHKAGYPMPLGMKTLHLVVAALIAGIGLTVALFVSGEAYPFDGTLQGPAKMGAIFSGGIGALAIAIGLACRIEKIETKKQLKRVLRRLKAQQ